jgi:hypothetical protein
MKKKSCPARVRNFSFHQIIYNGSGTNPMETGGVSLEMKQSQHEADHISI